MNLFGVKRLLLTIDLPNNICTQSQRSEQFLFTNIMYEVYVVEKINRLQHRSWHSRVDNPEACP